MGYSFARHETFHIRFGWLRKGLQAVQKNDHIFLETIPAMDELGIGKNMVSSLRYWMQATGLTEEDYNDSRQKVQELTQLAETILKYDEYFEDPATFWLLHFNLVTNKELATTWHWFFNYFYYLDFDRKTFINELIDYIRRTGEELPAESSLESDFQVFIRTYLSNSKEYLYNPQGDIKSSDSPEDYFMKSPFRELKLITEDDEGKYRVNRPTLDRLPPQIMYYCLLENLDEGTEAINVEDVLDKEDSIGRVFKLNRNILYSYLEKLQEMNYLRLDKHAGLNSIQLRQTLQKEVLDNYYKPKSG